MYFSLQILAFIDRRSSLTDVDLFIEGAELLIVLHKCPHTSIQLILGVYINTFYEFITKYWSFVEFLKLNGKLELHYSLRKLYLPLYKLQL